MQVSEIMTGRPICCLPEDPVDEVASRMAIRHFGAMPVVDSYITNRLVGIVTDRDITCRVVARNRNPHDTPISLCMSPKPATVTLEDTVAHCSHLMAEDQVRRLPVVDEFGTCLGIVAQADIARALPDAAVASTVRGISAKSEQASRLAA